MALEHSQMRAPAWPQSLNVGILSHRAVVADSFKVIRLRRILVEPRPDDYRAYIVRYCDQQLGEIAFSSYEAHHTRRGWRIVLPEHLSLERYRFRWQAARRLLQERGPE